MFQCIASLTDDTLNVVAFLWQIGLIEKSFSNLLLLELDSVCFVRSCFRGENPEEGGQILNYVWPDLFPSSPATPRIPMIIF